MNPRVVIIGAGPTGLTAAALLTRYGVECVVLERWGAVYPQPRAVHLDDEVYRILGRLGLAEDFAAVSWPCHGLRLLDPGLRVLAEFRRAPGDGRHGYPQANMFDQPDLERLLRSRLEAIGGITPRGDTEVTSITQNETGPVRVEVTDRVTGARETIHADYVLGCDGANSLARASIGAMMTDLRFDQRWLVVDVATRTDLGEWEGVHQVCNPQRAATYMRIGKTRYRWELRLLPGESGEDFRERDRLHPLIAPWTKHVPADELEIVRVAEYTFRAQIADRWRDRRVFLLGDAAHLTPPFIGQGMGAGLRDAANLAWKLAGVIGGTLPEDVLASYEAERKPHARAMVRMAVLIGKAMTEGGRFGDLIRKVVAPRLALVPALAAHVLDSETPALRRSILIERPRLRRTLAGHLCPNTVLDDGRRLDDVVAGRFAVVTALTPSEADRTAIQSCGAVLITAHRSGELDRWLRAGRTDAAIVRPDGTALRSSNSLSQLCRSLPRFTAAWI
ncbi:bifunctional 3-(3-hydroxy-phenyl)propionate/3-hydroxycinnamic acid hydroxylase [Actinospica sp. MGRD01-02]|uniref:Bifunctional 3-(3-hydroxy-phenyl)propionate/3-hydroxycinnamic acid hydroxylase n=1 Tax=Actinospica acidithermotolerans TaxID=2828514 RepID=A0A941IJR3_9ACTN|nr:bifunctional 3-(3-hydroxy-phenyl)propionate/3-hydroxycinnamic acid hydroxylase [Actinospica acidithermotolerans]